MKAYILAAGYATRLYPLTRDRPKPLLEVGGRPLLSHTLDRLRALPELDEIIVIGNHRFHDVFQSWADGVDSPAPLRVLDDGSMSDDDKLGAIGDLAFALQEAPPANGEDLLVLAGDNWLGFELAPLYDAYREQVSRTLLTVRDLGAVPDGPSPYNEVTTDGKFRVVRFREKPETPSTALVAIAVYFFPPTIPALLGFYLEHGGNPDAPGRFIEWLVQHAPVHCHGFDGEWLDIGSHETLARAREILGDPEQETETPP
jgi:glucose-1-phosphate thymidylyltransferase